MAANGVELVEDFETHELVVNIVKNGCVINVTDEMFDGG